MNQRKPAATCKKPLKSAAILTIKRPGTMTPVGRREIALWLRRQATNLLKYGKGYNDTGDFRARFLYE